MGHNLAGFILPHLQDGLTPNTKKLALQTGSRLGATNSVVTTLLHSHSSCQHTLTLYLAVNLKVHNRACGVRHGLWSRNLNLSSDPTFTIFINLVKLLNFSLP